MKRIRVQILDAHVEGGELVIDKVKPEGKREMSYDEFLRSGTKTALGVMLLGNGLLIRFSRLLVVFVRKLF